MAFDLYATTFLAGLLYVFIPGPATLAALSLSATVGRAACARFLGFHLLGDLTWAILAICAIVGISQTGPLLFDLLGIVCGLYLGWLGVKALRSSGRLQAAIIHTPWISGLIFGYTNPKAYPFALAMFTAVFARHEEAMTFENAAPLVFAAFCGFSVATLGVVFWTGLPITPRAFSRYGLWMTRAIGLVFIAAGAKAIVSSACNIRIRA